MHLYVCFFCQNKRYLLLFLYLQVSLLLDATEVEKILADKDLLHKVLHDKEALGRDAKKTA